jgi:16S rRNA (cytidine1402-2'-O)-methyltransferase
MPGTLFVVATPIGNLEDISLRALRVLREASVVAAEDTRRTAKLLQHFEIDTPQLSLHEHNERWRLKPMLERLSRGELVALVTDAGTPLVSDPGAELVRAVLAAGHRVEVVPGPSAVLAALVGSGLSAEAFTFLGFPPPREGARRAWLRAAGAEPRTVVFFEAPHRIAETLADLVATLGDRDIAVGRELTKLHEEMLRGPASDVLARLGAPRGEYTVVVAPPGAGELGHTPPALDDARAWEEFQALTAAGARRREAIATIARRYGRPGRDVYAAVERGRPARLP